MPRHRFRRADDALEQLERASAYHERLFGARPVGLWPSEGSVSDEMIPLAARAGFKWMATDELILAKTQGFDFGRDAQGIVNYPERLYVPYRVGSSRVACAFRDHALSDLIGFVYSGWHSEDAAEDFVSRLTAAGRRFHARAAEGEATIFVILDGENAWEHFTRALAKLKVSRSNCLVVGMNEHVGLVRLASAWRYRRAASGGGRPGGDLLDQRVDFAGPCLLNHLQQQGRRGNVGQLGIDLRTPPWACRLGRNDSATDVRDFPRTPGQSRGEPEPASEAVERLGLFERRQASAARSSSANLQRPRHHRLHECDGQLAEGANWTLYSASATIEAVALAGR